MMAGYMLACCLLAPVLAADVEATSADSLQSSDLFTHSCLDCDDTCWACVAGQLAGFDDDSPSQLTIFLGLDGSKQPQDLGVNAHLGGRTAANFTHALFPEWGIGGQIGAAVNYSDSAVRVMDLVEGTKERFQTFTTVGLFRNGERLKLGIVYDHSSTNYYDSYDLGQFRGRLGWVINECHELGTWFSVGSRNDRTFFNGPLGGEFFQLEPLSQAHLYWRKTWENQLETSMWLGIAEGHGEVIATVPGNPSVNSRMSFGADIHIPLNDHMALFGEANFLAPSDSGTVDSYLGLVYYPFGNARRGRTSRYSAILPVASNPTMTVDLRR